MIWISNHSPVPHTRQTGKRIKPFTSKAAVQIQNNPSLHKHHHYMMGIWLLSYNESGGFFLTESIHATDNILIIVSN